MRLESAAHSSGMKRIVLAYWLIPAEPARSFFQSLIIALAQRYNAPMFEPHVTVHVGANCTDTIDGVLSEVAQDCERIALHVLKVSGSSEFIKTLFVQFGSNTRLQQVNQSIRNAARDSSDYDLNPHLSLMYKPISIQDRRLLERSIEIPFSEVAFDSLKAVRCVSPTRSRADVEAWQLLAEKSLGSMGV